MKQKNGFSKDFILVLVGQIISLFGNAVMRFALPLHLLSVTGSSSLLGLVSGCAFIPLAVMSPVGGLIADRVNKRNIMVILDFLTAGLVLLFLLLEGKVNLVSLMLVMLFLLYGISGAYQPSVQSSIPLLVSTETVLPANAAINMVSSLSGLLGPALGGMVYAAWGIRPVLYVCAGCFTASAVMEIFIRIPHEKKPSSGSLLRECWKDLKESVLFIVRTQAQIGKLTLCCACVNLVLSALMIIGLPVIVMQVLPFPEDDASRLYGFMQAILAVGGLAGGMGAGVFSKKMKLQTGWRLLLACAVLVAPMGAVLLAGASPYVAYAVFAVCGMAVMAFSSIFSIQALSYIQIVTPPALIGKVLAWIIAISTCAMPAGQILYGYLFEACRNYVWGIFFGAAVISALVAYYSRKISERL